MHEYTATVRWSRGEDAFAGGQYSRAHEWSFDGGVRVRASASPLSVRLPYSDPSAVDPEEALVAALSSCHMLWFLSLAAGQGHVVNYYEDRPVGIMTPGTDGRLWVSRVTLEPHVHIAADGDLSDAAHHELHEKAHRECYIANSVKTTLITRPRLIRDFDKA